MELPGYRLTRSIGNGAASTIHEAVELRTGKTVAVKHVVRKSAADDRFFRQAETEYEIGSQLDHPSLRRILSIHRIRKVLQVRELMLVMEYVDGLNLEKARPNRLNTFLILFQRVAAGLDAMHESGYLHTDIKPTNILVARGGAVKIIDFGQSCRVHHRKTRIQGTPDYIAPEQVGRLPLDRRTDVFNLGATMYWVLTSETYPTVIRGVDARGGISLTSPKRPLAPVELNDKIPLSLSRLVMECCSEKPDDRPANMKQIISRLQVVRKLWNRHRLAQRTQRKGQESSGSGVLEPPTISDQMEWVPPPVQPQTDDLRSEGTA